MLRKLEKDESSLAVTKIVNDSLLKHIASLERNFLVLEQYIKTEKLEGVGIPYFVGDKNLQIAVHRLLGKIYVPCGPNLEICYSNKSDHHDI